VLPPENQLPTVIRVTFASPDGTVRDQDGNLVEDDDAIPSPPGGKKV
jgi:hypothetical protein